MRHLCIFSETVNTFFYHVSVGNPGCKSILYSFNFEHIFGSTRKPMEAVKDLATLVEDLVRFVCSAAALGCQNE